MKIVGILLVMFCLQSCATSIMTKDKYDGFKISLSEELKNKNLKIRTFSWSDAKIFPKGENAFETRLSRSQELATAVQENISLKNHFKNITFNQIIADEIVFEKTKIEDNSKVIDFLMKDLDSSTDHYYIDIYEYHLYLGIYHPYFEFLWLLAHAGSLGLIPYREPIKIEMRANLYGPSKVLLKSFEVKNNAAKWMWSPNIFRDESKSLSDPEFSKMIIDNTLNKVLQETLSAIE